MPRFDKLLVLDLDETLIHSVETPLPWRYDFRAFEYYVYNRPGLARFLRSCLDWFTVGVWSSSGGEYAQHVVKHLFQDPDKLEFVWSSLNCSRVFDSESRHVGPCKDVKKLVRRGFPKEKIIMVDDSPEKLAKNYGNGVIVVPFDGSREDTELDLLVRYLEWLGPAEDVRRIEKRNWQRRVLER